MTKVEIYCKNEDVVVAIAEGAGGVDAEAVKRATGKDLARFPPDLKTIKDGAQLWCNRCKGRLWFRAAEGEPVLALPGYVKGVS